MERKEHYINWDKEILPELKIQLQEFEAQKIKPTIRGLLYIFESKELLKKTDYQGISRHLVKWREDGILPLNCVADKTRAIIDIRQLVSKSTRIFAVFNEKLQTWNELITPEYHIQSGIDYLSDTVEDIYSHIPRWLGQPKYEEVFVEKNAIADSFDSILNTGDDPRRVIVNPNGGWSSYTFVMNNIERLRRQKRKGKEVYVQYYGDSDPTGERMTADDSKLVTKLTEYGIHFERIAIDEETIRDFELEDIRDKELDADTIEKLENDPNYEWFTHRHHGDVWQIELDALQFDLVKFKELVLSNVDKHYDPDIREEALEEFEKLYPKVDINKRIMNEIDRLKRILKKRNY